MYHHIVIQVTPVQSCNKQHVTCHKLQLVTTSMPLDVRGALCNALLTASALYLQSCLHTSHTCLGVTGQVARHLFHVSCMVLQVQLACLLKQLQGSFLHRVQLGMATE